MKLIFASLLATALAGPVSERQSPHISADWFNDRGCNGDNLGFWYIAPGTVGECIQVIPPTGQQSTNFTETTLTRPVEFYNTPDCSKGNFYTIFPGQLGCFYMPIGSIKYV
ncbi:hypothetical protein CC78DRAFT_582011 [Lojkania enalia]|uniref:Uncharacterized protein n=1 Tax=Lojkania enalia TaxID=147567 RepID=A0A9P4K716_9PLEO|nr:hypothetical protein CC78DRAFT_582011 [Didymosphaeria enalia]